MITKKIILGSANINTIYGLRKNKISLRQFRSLMNYSLKKGVKFIDTSPAYKNSDKIIEYANKKFEIITKVPKLPKNLKIQNIENWTTKIVERSKEKLKNKIYGFLITNVEHLSEIKLNKIYNTLLKLKKLKYINKVGFSIYDFKILEQKINDYKIDFVQLPFNVLDQRLVENKLIYKLKKKKIEIHARSIFLQGLLTMSKIKLPKKLYKLKKILFLWNKWLIKNKIDGLSACLEFVLNFKFIDKFVIGVNNFNNFKEIINYKKKKINFRSLAINPNYDLLDPRKWN